MKRVMTRSEDRAKWKKTNEFSRPAEEGAAVVEQTVLLNQSFQ